MKMEMKKYNCVFALADQMCEDLEHLSGDYNTILAVGKYSFIKRLLEDLIMNGVEIDLCVELFDPTCGDYNDEYYLSLSNLGVCVEQAKRDGKYLNTGGQQITYISDECCSRILNYIDDGEKLYEVHIDDKDDENDEPDEYDCNKRDECNKYTYIVDDIFDLARLIRAIME